MSSCQYDKDCGYEIFRRLSRAKEPEAYLLTGDADAPWSQKIPGEVEYTRQEKSPIPEVE